MKQKNIFFQRKVVCLMTNKKTKTEYFNELKSIPAVAENEDMVKFIDHEIELLAKKSASKKATKNKVENEGFKATIMSTLSAFENPVTVTELQKSNEELNALSNQRVSAILRQMVESGEVVKVVDKKKALFSVA